MESLAIENFLATAYKNQRVFVTGHTGFKGSWFITWLNMLGAVIKGYALAPDEKGLFNEAAAHLRFESVIADIRDKARLETEITNFQPDFIFHFAAQPLVRRSYEIPAETFEVNATGTANLLQCVSKLTNKCIVVIITTDKVYQNREIQHHYKESDVLGGYDPYSASKACCEIIVSSFRNSFFSPDSYSSHRKAIVTVRAGNVIGGGDWNKDRIIPDVVTSLSKGFSISVRNPRAVRPWQHVLEPLNGYLLLAGLLSANPSSFSHAYNFGPETNDHLTVGELVDIAISCWGSGKWTDASDDTQPHEAGLLQLDISLAKTELGWKPKLNSKEAIEWTVEWYRQANDRKFEFTLEQIRNYVNR